MTTKRSRRTRAELREMVMQAGKEILLDIEPSVGFEELTYSTVFAHLAEHHGQKVTIGSVHERLWNSQRDFQLDVIEAALNDALPTVHDDTMAQAAAVMARVDLSTPAGRRYALQSAVRQTSYHLSEPEFSPPVKLIYVVRFRLWNLGPDHPEAAPLRDVIARLRTTSTAKYVEIVHHIMQALNLRVRTDAGDPEEAVQSIAVLGNAARIGLRTDVLEAAHKTRLLPTGPSGELEEWHNDALALWSLVRCTVEFNDDDLADHERRL